MVVVLGEGDHITLACDLQTATAGDLLRQVQSRKLFNKNIASISDVKILCQNLLQDYLKHTFVSEIFIDKSAP